MISAPDALWVTLLEVVSLGGGPRRDVSGGILRPGAGQNPKQGAQCKRGGHCERNSQDKMSAPIGTVNLQLAAGWHHKRAKFGHRPQGGACSGVKVYTKI